MPAAQLYSSIYETEKDLECEKKEAEDLKQIDQENAAIVYEGDSWKACEVGSPPLLARLLARLLVCIVPPLRLLPRMCAAACCCCCCCLFCCCALALL